MKLIKLSDYVLEVNDNIKSEVPRDEFAKVYHYAKLLKQKPELGMFIPCDLDGNVLEEPKKRCLDYDGLSTDDFVTIQEEYQEAKERVLFKGLFIFHENEFLIIITHNDNKVPLLIYMKEGGVFKHNRNKIETLEDLVPYELELNREL